MQKQSGPIALISVYNKQGIVDFAKELTSLGWQILASGGTAKALVDAGVEVHDVATLVGGGPILGHRVVTLSREVHAGLLATQSREDLDELQKLGIPFIDLVCVDLYPLEDEIKKPGATPDSVIEKTDIGGPTILRSAAKGRRIVVCDSKDRQKVIAWLKAGQPDKNKFVSVLAAKAEFVVSQYTLASARYHSKDGYDGMVGEKIQDAAYGENAWQTPAALYKHEVDDALALNNFKILQGSSPSYNNWCDVDRLLQTLTHIAGAFHKNYGSTPFIAVGGKHGNACGAAFGTDPIDVLKKMISGDTRAIFGGLVIVNFSIGNAEAETLLTHLMPAGQRRLLDGIIAPSFKNEILDALKRKGDKCRLFANPSLENLDSNSLDSASRFRYVRGGFLKQPNYTFILDLKDTQLDKSPKVGEEQEKNLLLAWAVGSTSNSNTVTLVKDAILIGNGVGQQDRVGACQLALKRASDAGHNTQKAAAYSDSFFPFSDGPAVLAEAGITAILATSGSVKDSEIKEFCKNKGVALYLITDKLGRGFFGH